MTKHGKNIVLTLIDGVFLLRPVVLIPVWGFALFGYFQGSDCRISTLPHLWQSTGPFVLVWIIIFSLSVGAVYVFNQIADIEVDRKNGGLPLLASGIVSLPTARLIAAIAVLISVVVPAAAGQAVIAFFSGASIVLGIAYSFRPAYLSGRPFFDFLANAFGFGVIAFGAGWHLAGRSATDAAMIPAAFPYFALMCAGAISSTIPDRQGDEACGKRTTAVAFGEKNAQYIAMGCVAVSSVYSIAVRDWIAALCSIASLPGYVFYAIKPGKVLAEATYKVGGALCMTAAAAVMPLFALCAGTVFFATWIYFRLRHGVSYPSLLPVATGTAHSRGQAA